MEEVLLKLYLVNEEQKVKLNGTLEWLLSPSISIRTSQTRIIKTNNYEMSKCFKCYLQVLKQMAKINQVLGHL